jgi:hypothetical protein
LRRVVEQYVHELSKDRIQVYKSIHGRITPEDEGDSSFATLESNYPITHRNNPEDLIPQYENTFTSDKQGQLL